MRALIRAAKHQHPQLAEHALQFNLGGTRLMTEVGDRVEDLEEVVEGLVDVLLHHSSSYLPACLQARRPAPPLRSLSSPPHVSHSGRKATPPLYDVRPHVCCRLRRESCVGGRPWVEVRGRPAQVVPRQL